ncbi:MAG: hypothetical protein Hyperionvirus32_5 [Hyperionvirus sp.]|uniref:Uncharacterized protein n=1 Tax=Hyperionvirus sp. TaxID=2487770 RepID=A0A3G5ABL7_9VIRU|nr:MAG: hypothetical protein Hyperionvirus32_5 [Hyperionvirus sp.]
MPSETNNFLDSERMDRCYENTFTPVNQHWNRIYSIDPIDSYFIFSNYDDFREFTSDAGRGYPVSQVVVPNNDSELANFVGFSFPDKAIVQLYDKPGLEADHHVVAELSTVPPERNKTIWVRLKGPNTIWLELSPVKPILDDKIFALDEQYTPSFTRFFESERKVLPLRIRVYFYYDTSRNFTDYRITIENVPLIEEV